MGSTKKTGLPVDTSYSLLYPAQTSGSLGSNDRGDPNVVAQAGDTAGSSGINDHGSPPRVHSSSSSTKEDATGYAGSVLVSGGDARKIRIPIPGTKGLYIEFVNRGYQPKGGSTAGVFIQDKLGKRYLMLDYSFNKAKGSVEYHWNQSGTFDKFKIANHTSAGKSGEIIYKASKTFVGVGKRIVIIGLVLDGISIVIAKKKLRQVVKVVGGWQGAALGCRSFGAIGALAGSAEPGGGNIILGGIGCAVGLIVGGIAGSEVAGSGYDLIEEIYFEHLSEENSQKGLDMNNLDELLKEGRVLQ
jgi:hypothetical protein